MAEQLEIFVTLSAELLSHLRCRADNLDVPLDWFVVGLICDTIDGCEITRK